MDSKVADVWRLRWPKSIPEHEYETAMMLAQLFSASAPKPEGRAPAATRGGPAPADTISANEAAEILGMSVANVYLRSRRGKLRGYRAGGRGVRFSRSECEALRPGPRLIHSAPSTADAVTVKEAAKELGVGLDAIYLAISKGRLAATVASGKKTGRKTIARADLDAYRASRLAAAKEA